MTDLCKFVQLFAGWKGNWEEPIKRKVEGLDEGITQFQGRTLTFEEKFRPQGSEFLPCTVVISVSYPVTTGITCCSSVAVISHDFLFI